MKKIAPKIYDDSFDVRLEKRCRMFEAMGVELPEYSRSKDKENMFLQSVIDCHYCKNDDLCSKWLKEDADARQPSEFCANYDLILVLLADKNVEDKQP